MTASQLDFLLVLLTCINAIKLPLYRGLLGIYIDKSFSNIINCKYSFEERYSPFCSDKASPHKLTINTATQSTNRS